MFSDLQNLRRSQIIAWAVAALFILGFIFPLVGAFTGVILATWFIGTQRPLQGFIYLVALNFLLSLVFGWSSFPLTGVLPALDYIGWMLVATILLALPFVFHRLLSPQLSGFVSTLPLPLAAAAVHGMAVLLPSTGAGPRFTIISILFYWFAAIILWLWNSEAPAQHFAVAASYFFSAQLFIVILSFLLSFLGGGPGAHPLYIGSIFGSLCLIAAAALAIWALLHPEKHRIWADQPQAVAQLRSPHTGETLQLVREKSSEFLLSPSGERFPFRDGIPVFLEPADLTGANLKYNELYELIGGFYDDFQRVVLAFRGLDREAWFRTYMDRLEVKSGEAVLETSVGTGLNFKFLPKGVQLSGLDLSPEMLINCQTNLSRWHLEANLVIANAEALPYADSIFDVVFHIGGINVFNDRAKAIREMIRVAKPGSLLLIADETEKHVKSFYETTLGAYFKRRKQPVTPPIDLVPPEMHDINLEELRDGHFYALSFRKPSSAH